MYDIKRLIGGVATIIATVRPSSGQQVKRVMGENIVDMAFTLSVPVDFEIGDFVTVYGETYTLNKPAQYTKNDSSEYEYTAQFQGSQYELSKYAYLMLGAGNVIKEPDFSIMGTAEVFIDLIILNANRVSGGWTKGDVDVTETKNLTFSNTNCLAALSTLADEFKTEFWIIGKTIHFTTKGASSGLTFEYGKGKGLYTITRSNKEGAKVVTRLYPFGSSRNLPANYRNYSQRLRLPAADGDYIEQGVAEFGVIEDVVIFEDIKPQRVGTVTAIDVANVLKFSDAGMDFDLNAQKLPNTSPKVQFLSGLMAGYEFVVNSYDAGTKTFTINKNDNEKAFDMPGAVLKPQVGDTYITYDVDMPGTYVTAAENQVKTRAQAHLSANAINRLIYSVACDPLFFKQSAVSVTLGNTVLIKDVALGINDTIRVIGFTRSILLDGIEEYRHSLELSESIQQPKFVRDMIKDELVQNVIRINDLTNPAKARANWRTSQEMLQMVFDPDGDYFTEKIKPGSIETQLLSVGARSQQFQMNVLMQPNFGGNDSHFVSSSGVLDHFSIDPNAVRTWAISASSYTGLPPVAYYIYAKCEKAGANGTLLLSTAQIKVSEDNN